MPGNIRNLNHSLLALLMVGALSWGVVHSCAPAAAQTPNGASVDAAEAARLLDERAAQARRDGFWVVQAGDHFYRIARAFVADDRARMERLRQQLIAENPQAYMAGKPALLIVGSRIKLPSALLEGSQLAATGVAGGNTTPPPAPPPPQPTMQTATRVAPAPSVAAPGVVAQASTAGTVAAGTLKITPVDPSERVPVPRRERPVYVDKLIEGAGPDNELGTDAERVNQGAGRKSASLGYSHSRRDRTEGLSRDAAMELRLTTETENYGDFRLDSQWVQFNPAAQDLLPARRSFNATLYNTQLPVGENWTADSALGVVRSLQPLWVTSSYRVILPSSLLMGATTLLASDQADIRLAMGNTGRLAGIGILDFERTSGRLATASTSLRLAPAWQVGGALMRFTDSVTIPDHTAATLAVEYHPDPGLRLRGHLLANSGGRSGAWSDLEFNPGRWRHRAGAYTLDPDLAYGDSRPQNDIRGAYVRSEYRSGFDIYVAGVESSQSNIKNDPARSGTASDGGYVSASLRLDRNTSVGAGLSYRQDRPRQGAGESRNVAMVTGFWSRQFGFGLTRLDGSVNRTRSEGGASERVSTLQWTHDFPRWNQLALSLQAGNTRERLMEGLVDRRSLGFTLRGPLFGNAFWDANMTLVEVAGEGQSERGYNSSVGIDWPISGSLNANLSWQRNQLRPGVDNILNPFRRENTVLLNIRYDLATGVPYQRVVGPGGRQGTGTISGAVFYDENGDGVRQATERGADGILVLLDGRFPVTTTRDGSFTFGSVGLGNHSVVVQLEKVPLPWGLSDESPRIVNVRLREEARLEIGLTRISP